ncbi:alkyl hydroperoxide reductase subunit F [Carboxylicivirga linearis]|uniref:Alkyl hydroperoxide reductase subunit F n=1 Tax=Carboxylicivirga linearis TaxID=1628157 RepID=A0ABS5JT71_9BACT|nr:alkyl hydroperoxide reductase subunit F [Carboxylicivirga linearis]MBS2097571.1 alkyl hydroperoxide reductase subunit F [Carboxylicivirga linearis]
MLEQALKDQVRSLFANLQNSYSFVVTVANDHKSKNDLVSLLQDVASCSDKVEVIVKSGTGLSFTILKNNNTTNVTFRAVPTGHEFTTLLLAILNQDGIGKNLPDEVLSERIKNIDQKLELKSYISLSCTNCPDVVQALNIMAFNNPLISHEIIDGSINQQEVDNLGIQAVPTVFANGKQLHVGRSSIIELISKIEDQLGTEFKPTVKVNKEYDVVVVGGGPAGASAAIYSARKGFKVAVVAEKIGGQVTETVDIENMISVPKTTGNKLSGNLMEHLNEYPIDILENRMVEKLELENGIKKLTSSLGETISTPALIIATGASWRKLGVPGENEYIGSGVAFCTHCDGPFYKGKKVVVIGGGNSGLEAAIDLSSIASEVTVLEFMDTLKGDQILQDKLATMSNVNIITNAQTLGIDGDGQKVTDLKFKDRTTDKEEVISTDGVFVQIGLKANSSVFTDVVETNRMGEIEIDASCRTKQPGIYAAGDVSVVPYKQIVIAMGEGSKAALSAFEDQIKGKLIAN